MVAPPPLRGGVANFDREQGRDGCGCSGAVLRWLQRKCGYGNTYYDCGTHNDSRTNYDCGAHNDSRTYSIGMAQRRWR